MEQFLQLYLPSAILLVGFSAQAFVQWRLKTSQAVVDGVDQYKKVIEAYEKRIEQMDRDHKYEIQQLRIQLNEHSENMGRMKALIEEKDKRLKEYLEILQEKDPDSKRVIQFVDVATAKIQEFTDDNNVLKSDVSEVKDTVQLIYSLLKKG